LVVSAPLQNVLRQTLAAGLDVRLQHIPETARDVGRGL
jgi:hypothetical protein